MAIHPCRQCIIHILLECIRRHGKNRDSCLPLVGQATDISRRLIAIHMGHLDIHQNQVIASGQCCLQLFGTYPPVLCPVDLAANLCKQRDDNLCIELVVLREQDMAAGQLRIVAALHALLLDFSRRPDAMWQTDSHRRPLA